MKRHFLEGKDIEQLRQILQNLDPSATVKASGINRNVLIKRILILDPETEGVEYYMDIEKRIKRYVKWSSDLHTLSALPYLALEQHEKELMVHNIKRIYRDYRRTSNSEATLLSLPNFLYYLSFYEIVPFADYEQLMSSVDSICRRAHSRSFANTRTDSKGLDLLKAQVLAKNYGSLARIPGVVGPTLHELITRIDRERFQEQKESLMGISNVSLQEALEIINMIYNSYEQLRQRKTCFSRNLFMIQLAERITTSRTERDFDDLLFNFPEKIVMVNTKKLLDLYGNHAYNRQFLGFDAIPASSDDFNSRPYVAVLLGQKVKVIGTFSSWESLEEKIKSLYPMLAPKLKKCKYCIYDVPDATLLVQRSIID